MISEKPKIDSIKLKENRQSRDEQRKQKHREYFFQLTEHTKQEHPNDIDIFNAAKDYLAEIHSKLMLDAHKDSVQEKWNIRKRERIIAGERTKKLEELAKIDHLTGLPNRKALEEELSKRHRALILDERRQERKGAHFGLLMLDIDHFKRINDNYGHQAGDTVLREFAKIINKNIRLTDFPARFGGEEFTVIAEYDTSVNEVAQVAERIRRAVEESQIHYGGDNNNPINITVSIGVSPYVRCANDSDTYSTENDMMIKLADSALYAAKGNEKATKFIEDDKLISGETRNRVVYYDTNLSKFKLYDSTEK